MCYRLLDTKGDQCTYSGEYARRYNREANIIGVLLDSQQSRDNESIPSGLVVIACDASGEIVAHIISYHDLVGAPHTGYCMMKLKIDSVRVEVHHGSITLRSIVGNR